MDMWDFLEMIGEVSPSIEQERMNTRGKEVETSYEYECYFHIYCSTIRNFGSHLRTSVANKYIRVKNWNKKPGPILK